MSPAYKTRIEAVRAKRKADARLAILNDQLATLTGQLGILETARQQLEARVKTLEEKPNPSPPTPPQPQGI